MGFQAKLTSALHLSVLVATWLTSLMIALSVGGLPVGVARVVELFSRARKHVRG